MLRADVLLVRGEALLRCGDEAAAREAFAAAAAIARDAGDAERLARAALGASGLGVTIIAVDEWVVGLLREALGALTDDGPLRARLLARTAIETYYVSTPPQRKATGDEAVRVAQRSRDPAALVAALNARRVALWSAAYLTERLDTAAEMVAAAERAGDVEGVLQGRNWLVADLLEAGEVDAARAEVERHEALADRLRLPAYQWWGPMWRSTLAIAAGRVGEAEGLIAEFAAIGARTADRNALLYAEVQRFVLAMMGFGEPPRDRLARTRARPPGRLRLPRRLRVVPRGPGTGRRGARPRRVDRRGRLGAPRGRHEPPRRAVRGGAGDRDRSATRRTPPAPTTAWPRTPPATSSTRAARAATARPSCTSASLPRCSGGTRPRTPT